MSDSETKARPNDLAAKETGIAYGVFPEECPFDAREVLDLEFFPEDREFE